MFHLIANHDNHRSVASANRQLFQLYYAWKNKKSNDDDASLIDLCKSCEQSKLIPQLVQLPWNPSQQDLLVHYLLNVSNVKGAKLQAVLCLLLHGKLDVALKHKDVYIPSTGGADDDDDDLFQSGMVLSAMVDSYSKNFPHFSSSVAPSNSSSSPPVQHQSTQQQAQHGLLKNEKYNSQQESQTPFTDSNILNESVRRRRSRKPKDHTPMPSHSMTTRASARKKSLGP